jgi:DNA-binding NarL/FixJ family response regulator
MRFGEVFHMFELGLEGHDGVDQRIELLALAFGRLTKRESQIVALLAHGRSNKEIARKLSISEGTVKVHMGSIATKLGYKHMSSRTKIAILAIRYGGFKVNDSLLLFL